jgi:hypothetical protein
MKIFAGGRSAFPARRKMRKAVAWLAKAFAYLAQFSSHFRQTPQNAALPILNELRGLPLVLILFSSN